MMGRFGIALLLVLGASVGILRGQGTAAPGAIGDAPLLPEYREAPLPPAYGGVQVRIPGIYVTPVVNAPFTAKVQIVSQEQLPDGTVRVRKTVNHIARQSSGRIYNERRQLVAPTFQGEPRLISAHIYDPSTRLNTYLNPVTHIAQEIRMKQAAVAPNYGTTRMGVGKNPLLKEEELGEQALGPVMLRGIRRSRTVPAAVSGTGKDVVVVDEYWYSAELEIYMIIKHNDPRTGEQIVAVSDVERGEPDGKQFVVPGNYKRVDETPVD
ncbi:hypothetical protein [Granulicella tundricola]|uniref:Uncharacterized protein n=1 Tax=Granulicella tundricola (strain ATCC BAA-1859 / DSM 23138 / MP5ACTX9) TaxID=1198114 RepID=E8X470_GRATM|nr:hypothetical protein [Granulicella tundricola]ADW67130.1 hypothetical protein AciX9_0039 [Granulicella tundricola MP5ACTX9]